MPHLPPYWYDDGFLNISTSSMLRVLLLLRLKKNPAANWWCYFLFVLWQNSFKRITTRITKKANSKSSDSYRSDESLLIFFLFLDTSHQLINLKENLIGKSKLSSEIQKNFLFSKRRIKKQSSIKFKMGSLSF